MRKVIIATMMLAFTLLVNAEPLTITLHEGDQGLKLYRSHPECHNLSKDEFLAETAKLNGFENADENWRKIRAGEPFLLAKEKSQVEQAVEQANQAQIEPTTQTETKENTTNAPVVDDQKVEEGPNDSIDRLVVASAGYYSPRIEESGAAERPETVSSAPSQNNQVLESKVADLTTELSASKREKKHLREALSRSLAYRNNGSSTSSSYILPFIPISTLSYAIGSVGTIITLIILVSYLFFKVSRLKSDWLKQKERISEQYRQLMEKELAERIKPIVDESNRLKRNSGFMKRLLEPYYYFFNCPAGTVRKANKQPVDHIILKIVERPVNGLPLVEIPGIVNPIPAKADIVERALRTKEYQSQNDSFVLPPLEVPTPIEGENIERLKITHNLHPTEAQIAAAQ